MQIKKLNMLRGIAALIVVISHYSNSTGIFDNLLGEGSGQLGVMIFFILSGFLMSFLYMDKPFIKKDIHKFAVARFARVVPLFLFIILISYLTISLGFGKYLYSIPDLNSLFSHILLLSGTSVLWTIPVEIQFYLFFIFLWYLYTLKPNYLYLFMALSFVVISMNKYPIYSGEIFNLEYKIRLINSLPYFFVGVLYGRIYSNWSPHDKLLKNYYVYLALILILLLYPYMTKLIFGHVHRFWADTNVLFIVSLSIFFVIFLVPDNNKLMCNKIGDFLGKISYSLYLLHTPILFKLIKHIKHQPYIYFLVFILISIFVSYISYILIEDPLRKYFRNKSHITEIS